MCNYFNFCATRHIERAAEKKAFLRVSRAIYFHFSLLPR